MKSSSLIPTAFFISLSLSCGVAVVPLQGRYQDKIYEFQVHESKEKIWNKLIGVLIGKGMAIQYADQSNGIITTNSTSFLNSFSWEDAQGRLINPQAFVVCTKVKAPLTLYTSLDPDAITGQWTVLTKQEDGKTIIGIKLSNATGSVLSHYHDSNCARNCQTTYVVYSLVVKSTGMFERTIQDELNW